MSRKLDNRRSDESLFLMQHLDSRSEFGLNWKAWLHPALYQHFRLLMV